MFISTVLGMLIFCTKLFVYFWCVVIHGMAYNECFAFLRPPLFIFLINNSIFLKKSNLLWSLSDFADIVFSPLCHKVGCVVLCEFCIQQSHSYQTLVFLTKVPENGKVGGDTCFTSSSITYPCSKMAPVSRH